ncbi:MAG: septum formation initiator family protein [Candidatus Berkelbacteria bacterium]|nr:septum formation initiator family protein [Candidatus Berkelbacteria bacterium]
MMKFFNIFKRKRKPKKAPVIDKRPIWIVLILLLVAGYLIFIFSRSLWRNYEINKELLNLEAQIDSSKMRQDYLTNLVSYYGTKSFTEKEARGKLGLKKEGETVLALPRKGAVEKKQEIIEESNPVPEKTNAEKWWKFFFKR